MLQSEFPSTRPLAGGRSVELGEAVPTRHEAPDVAELRRMAEAANRDVVKGATYERDWPLLSRAVVAFAREMNPDVVLGLLDRLAHMTEARDNARAEVERLTAKLNAIEADDDKLSIMFGWLVYDVGEHTCGGYGPESGYAHEPGCGFEPVLRLDKLEGWPGEKPLDGRADS